MAQRFDKPCEMCKTLMINVNDYQRFCPECAKKRKKESDRVSKNLPKKVNKLCMQCNTLLIAVSRRQRYCSNCAEFRRRKQSLAGARRLRELEKDEDIAMPVKHRGSPTVSIPEMERRARAAGTSYGKYVGSVGGG